MWQISATLHGAKISCEVLFGRKAVCQNVQMRSVSDAASREMQYALVHQYCMVGAAQLDCYLEQEPSSYLFYFGVKL